MAEHLKLINDESPSLQWGQLVMTDTSKEILRSLHHIAGKAGWITMVAAVPGAGKTETLIRYTQNTRDTLKITVTAGEGKERDIIHIICDALGLSEPEHRSLAEQRRYIGEAIGTERTLLVDEAQYLVKRDPRSAINFDVFEWLRGMAEDSCFALCFAGDLSLSKHIGKCPQLRRRIKRPVVVRTVSKADVQAIAEHHGVTGGEAIAALHRVSNSYGGLGDVVSAINHAKLFSGSEQVSNQHLLAAIEDLKLNMKGAW